MQKSCTGSVFDLSRMISKSIRITYMCLLLIYSILFGLLDIGTKSAHRSRLVPPIGLQRNPYAFVIN